MKILFITFEPPSDFSGGGIVVKQSIMSLAENHTIDYVGPNIIDEECRSVLNRQLILELTDSRLIKLLDMLRGQTTGYYRSWLKKINDIEIEKYDAVHLEFSRYNFVTNYVKDKGKKVSLRVHNVEVDYYDNLYRSSKNIKLLIRKKLIHRQERECLKNSSIVSCLTENDKQRLISLYPEEINEKRVEVIPVCLADRNKKLSKNLRLERDIHSGPYLLATGSLWYGPNVDGIIWFINNVWDSYSNTDLVRERNIKLLVAGSNPNGKLKALINEYDNVDLVENPEDMSPFFRNALLYIAPIFNGAGMKVKVAEALSYGLPVVGTKHAFIGYEIDDKVNGYIANQKDEFTVSINQFLNNQPSAIENIKAKVLELYNNRYSMQSSINQFQHVIRIIEDDKCE